MLFEWAVTLNNIAKTQLSNIRKLGEKYAQNISIKPTQCAVIVLRPYTLKMGKETGKQFVDVDVCFRIVDDACIGKGVGKRMTDLLSAHIKMESVQIFAEMTQKIKNILEAGKHELFNRLVEQSTTASSTLYENLMVIFKDPVSQISDSDDISLLALKAKLSTEGHLMEKAWTDALKRTDLQNETGSSSIEGEDSDDSDSDDDGGD
jgi:hypothetical protein